MLKYKVILCGLGFCKINYIVEFEDMLCVCGMINKVYYMVKVEE